MKKITFCVLILTSFAFSAPMSAKQLFNVQTIEVKKVNEGNFKDFYGKTVVNEENVKEITLRYDAFIEELYVNKNFATIKKGEPLFKAYSSEVYTAQLELLGAIRIKNQGMIDSLVQKLRLLGVEEKLINKVLTDKQASEKITVNSPYSGFVTQKVVNAGSFISKGMKLYEISDYSSLWIMASVYEKDLAFVKNAKNADVFFDITNKTYKAKIDFIYPKVDPETKSVKVRLLVENKDLELFENAFAKVRFGTAKKEYLTLPKSAVLTKGNQTSVFVKGEFEGEFEPKVIEAKRLNNDTFEIISGLKEGDKVVNNALFMFDSDSQNNGTNR